MRKRVGTLGITAALLLTACGNDAQCTIRFSWWGGESRHLATQQAVAGFTEKHPEIDVRCEYGAWNGWEEAAAAAVYAGTEPDVMQVNRNWLTDFSSDTAGFLDLNAYSDIIDLSQYDAEMLDMCTEDGKLLCIPVSETGRVFFWNQTTFDEAGLEIPDSFSALCEAGTVFAEKLGDAYYPLALGWYDRMLFLVYHLQCRYGREWVRDGELQYSAAEIEESLAVIQEMEQKHVIPPLRQIAGTGAGSFDKDENWIAGKYAGIYEWDSSAGKYVDSLSKRQVLKVGPYFSDIGSYRGGFSKIALGFAVSKHTAHPEECAELISYLVSDADAVRTLGTERGIPLNHAAYDICADADLFGDISASAYDRMHEWIQFQIDPYFEHASLKSITGVYEDVFTGISYGDYSVSEGAERLCAGIQAVLAGDDK